MTEPVGFFDGHVKLSEQRRRIAEAVARRLAALDDAEAAFRMWMVKCDRA